MSVLHEPNGKPPAVSVQIQPLASTSSGKKLRDLLFKRRKSVSLAPPNGGQQIHSLSREGSPRAQRKNGLLGPLLGPGADRPRSQSVYSPASALAPRLSVQQHQLNAGSSGDVPRGTGGTAGSSTAVNKEPGSTEYGKLNRSNDSAFGSGLSLPMSRLLTSSARRDSIGGESRPNTPSQPVNHALQGQNQASQQQSITVGPTEFCEMFRGRAYSDSKHAAEIMEARRRGSDAKQISNQAPEDNSTTSSISPAARPQSPTERPQSQLLVPSVPNNQCITQTIPEHVEVDFVPQKERLSPAPAYQRARRASAFTTQTLTGGAGAAMRDLGGDSGEEALAYEARGRVRRYSDPFSNGFAEELTSKPGGLLRAFKRDGVAKAMSNFPKFTTSVPQSAIASSELGIDLPKENRPLVLWRDRRQGTHMFRLPLDEEEWQELTSTDPEIRNAMYNRTMGRHKCYELMPNSSKLVLLDTELLVISSFYALMFNGIRAAPVWNSSTKEFVGMLTVTDFIRILDHCYTSQKDGINLEGHKISTWIGILGRLGHHKDMVVVRPDDSLLDAICTLKEKRIHRLLVRDQEEGSTLYILTHKRILHYIYLLTHDLPKPNYMKQPIGELKLGTYENLASITMQTRLIDALRMLVHCSVSSLPVLDAEGHVVNIYSRSDVINLVSNESYKNLDNTIEEALKIPRESFEGLYVCSKSDSLETVLNWMVRMNIHRLLVVDNERKLEGVVSISDVINYIVVHQAPPTTGSPGLKIIIEDENHNKQEAVFEFSEKL